jgi:hypothetical protein
MRAGYSWLAGWLGHEDKGNGRPEKGIAERKEVSIHRSTT